MLNVPAYTGSVRRNTLLGILNTDCERKITTMKKLLSVLLSLAMATILGILPVMTLADGFRMVSEIYYIIPDSDIRSLSWDELLGYQYDTLFFAFNEIYARHGYKFETGSRCYNWFTQMPWYHANAEETSTNHRASYSQCSQIENSNRDLIVAVRKDMWARYSENRAYYDAHPAENPLNPYGIGMPTPPEPVNQPLDFEYISLQGNQRLEVYTAPSYWSYRANNGKVTCSANGDVYAMGYEDGWMLIMYEANIAGQFRVGYVDTSRIAGSLPRLRQLTWDYGTCEVMMTTRLTDDPALTGAALTTLYEGTQVIYLGTMRNDTGWDYIETTIDGQTARGFIPAGLLSYVVY